MLTKTIEAMEGPKARLGEFGLTAIANRMATAISAPNPTHDAVSSIERLPNLSTTNTVTMVAIIWTPLTSRAAYRGPTPPEKVLMPAKICGAKKEMALTPDHCWKKGSAYMAACLVKAKQDRQEDCAGLLMEPGTLLTCTQV